MIPLLAIVAVSGAVSLITSYVLYSKSKASSPSIPKLTDDDVTVPTVNEGTMLPVVFGTRDITSPIVSWYGNLQGDSSAGYTLGMHLILCQGSIPGEPQGRIRLTRISWGDKCCWLGDEEGGQFGPSTAEISNSNLFEDGNGISGTFEFYNGNGDKLFDPYLDQFIETGAGLVRDGWECLELASVVFKGVNLGSAPSLRNPSFRIQRTLTGWYDAKAEITPTVIEYPLSLVSIEANGNRYEGTFEQVGTENPLLFSELAVLYTDTLQTTPISATLNFEIFVNDVLIYSENRGAAFTHTISFEILPKYLKSGINVLKMVFVPGAGVGSIEYGIPSKVTTQTVVDMNPAHVIRECLTNKRFGLGCDPTMIDDVSFTECADRLHDIDKMGVSVKWSKSSTIEDFLKEILRHIDGVLQVDRTTGKFKLKLMRKDYELSNLIVLDKTNISSVENWKKTSFDDLHNTVQVTYYNTLLGASSGVSVSDVALVQEQGLKIQTSIDFPAFSNPEVIKKVALRELAVVSNPLLSCTVNANADALSLDIGDVFLLDWPKYETRQVPMRIYKMNFGDGTRNVISIDCIEDVTID